MARRIEEAWAGNKQVNSPLMGLKQLNSSTISILYRHEHTAYGPCVYCKYFPDTWLNKEDTYTQIFGQGEFAEEGVPYKYLKGVNIQRAIVLWSVRK